MKLTSKATSRIAALLVFAALAGACSSGAKKDGGSSDTGGSSASAGGDEESTEEGGEKPAGSKVVDSAPAGNVADGYKALGAAVRSGQGPNITAEAAKILGTNPNDPVALNALAMYHYKKGKIGAAKLLINRAFEKNQTSAALYNNYAVLLLEEGDHVGAAENFKKALRVDDRHAEAMGNLGSLYVAGGDNARALPLLEQSYRKNKNNPAIANNYAIALRANKDLDGAKRVYEEALKTNARDVPTLLNYAILLIEFMGKPKEGLDLVYKIKFLEQERKDVLTRANALEKKAKSELK